MAQLDTFSVLLRDSRIEPWHASPTLTYVSPFPQSTIPRVRQPKAYHEKRPVFTHQYNKQMYLVIARIIP